MNLDNKEYELQEVAVKGFYSDDVYKLQRDINDFFKANPHKKYVDLKFTTINSYVRALLIYRIEDEFRCK